MADKLVPDTYLGDGVYASFNGYHVVLDLRGQDSITRIVLETDVLDSLDRFRDMIADAYRRQAETGPTAGA